MVYAAKVEEVADNLTRKFVGFSSTPWLTVLNVCTYIHTVLTMLACFKKPDFLNLTIIMILFHARYNYQDVKKWHLRMAALLILVSWVFDLFWLFLQMGAMWRKDHPEHSGMELGLRRFVLLVTIISFLFRFVLLLVTWKISVEFERLFRNRGTLLDQNRFSSPPQKGEDRLYMA